MPLHLENGNKAACVKMLEEVGRNDEIAVGLPALTKLFSKPARNLSACRISEHRAWSRIIRVSTPRLQVYVVMVW